MQVMRKQWIDFAAVPHVTFNFQADVSFLLQYSLSREERKEKNEKEIQ